MKKTGLFIAAAIVVIIVAAGAYYVLREQYEKEIKGLKYELAHGQRFVPMKGDTVILHECETVEVVTSCAITAELDDLKKQHLIDEQLIEDLGLKLKQMDAVQTTSTETKDTARAEFVHNVNVFSYDDRWSHLQFSLQDSTFYYNIRDSLITVIYHEYKHKFLWWRWGVKGYKVKMTNLNPHSSIRYNSYVKPEK